MTFINCLFETNVKHKETCNITLEMSCIEIKNDKHYDLLTYPVKKKCCIQVC